jgi:hypothetical protein
MADRVKRSVSMPPDVDARIAAAAAAEGMSYSAWLARGALRELTIRDGLAAVAEYEAEHGAFTAEERAEADAWVAGVLARRGASDDVSQSDDLSQSA